MQHKSSFLLISTFLLVIIAGECQSKLMCYICDHCSSITPGTQLEACDESFFSSGGTELPSTMTTTETVTEQDTTMPSTAETSTTTHNSTLTTDDGLDHTTKMVDTTVTAESTTPAVPTPPTMGPAETTTAMPTPPLLGTVQSMMEQVPTTTMAMAMAVQHNDSMTDNILAINMTSTTDRNYMNSSTFRVRQTRHARAAEEAQGVSYHCYTLQIEANNTINTQRGCARVTTEESVCGQLKQIANNETMVKKCQYCTMNSCNGSSTLGISVATVILGLVAALLKHG